MLSAQLCAFDERQKAIAATFACQTASKAATASNDEEKWHEAIRHLHVKKHELA